MKKNKILTIVVTILFLQLVFISGITAVEIQDKNIEKEQPNIQSIEIVQHFSAPTITNSEDYVNIHVKETNSFISNVGEPILPIYLQTIEFPLGTHILDIKCTYSSVNEMQITKKIIPSQKPIIWDNKISVETEVNEEIYNTNQFYPMEWFSYRLGGGLNKNNLRTTFLTLQFHPVRYNPVADNIQFVEDIKLEVIYEEPTEPIAFQDEYDLVIITYDRFAPILKSLVKHKENYNIQTKLVKLKDIYNSVYFPVQGRDKQEQIKYFIKDAIENWNITYVMLVGNFRKMPIRYTHLETDTGGHYEELKFPTDLYYSDIYDSEGNFSCWDTNNNEIYGEWPYPEYYPMEDDLDLYPDVYVGRLACMFCFEVFTMVGKIKDYEKNAYSSDWFNKVVVCGGDTFNDSNYGLPTNYYEGEEANEKAIEFLTGFTPTRLWASQKTLSTSNITNNLNNGAGFLYMVGHGNPSLWSTHDPDTREWVGDYENKDMYSLKNKGKYPILMVGGCHNSQYDVTPLNIIKGILEEGLKYFEFGYYFNDWVPECWSWVFVKKFGGACIASMGSSGYGGVTIGDHNNNNIPDCVEGADGWFETQFFRLYSEEKIDMLGATYAQVCADYCSNFPVYTDRYDSKIVQTHVLFGDPSLKIGGYQP